MYGYLRSSGGVFRKVIVFWFNIFIIIIELLSKRVLIGGCCGRYGERSDTSSSGSSLGKRLQSCTKH